MRSIRTVRVMIGVAVEAFALWWAYSSGVPEAALLGLVAGVVVGLLVPIHPSEVKRERSLGLALAVLAGPLLVRWLALVFGHDALIAPMAAVGTGLGSMIFVLAWRQPLHQPAGR